MVGDAIATVRRFHACRRRCAMLASTLLSVGPSRYCLQAPASRNTQETCTTYNVLKIAHSLLRWTGDGSYADFYERALLNGILGTQRVPRNVHSHTALPQLSLEPDSSLADSIVPKHDVRLGFRHRRASPSRAVEGVLARSCCLTKAVRTSHCLVLSRAWLPLRNLSCGCRDFRAE